IRREAEAVGPDVAVLVEVILRSRPHPEQGFRSCIGILRLVKRYGAERVDAACARALVLGTRSYSSVAAILKNRREHTPAACAKRGCASPPSSRTSISAPIAASTAPCSGSSPPANGSASITTWS